MLAGGAGRRLGAEKSLIEFQGRPLIQWSADRLSSVCDEIVIVARSREQADKLRALVPGARIACDEVSGFGPVAGLKAGMGSARGEYAAAIGCDLPFINVAVIRRLFELAEGFDAAVPVREDGVLETLHAVYHAKKMAIACAKAIALGRRRIIGPLSYLHINQVPVDELRALDPELLTFFNINTPEDLEKARKLWPGSLA
jgi:molybdenum cofactor guanylyltransferase